jgi:methyl-accepting chemotaxis protein
MIFKDNRRKASNVTVDPKAQLRFAQPFAILLVASLATINLLFWQVFSSRGAMSSSAPPEAIAYLNNAMGQAVMFSSIGMFVIGVLTLILWLVYSHRIFGPMVPIRRQVEALKSGNFDFKINLRKNDEFKELADELNQLAEHLKKAKAKPSN